MGRYIIEVIHGSADGMPTERYIIRSAITGLSHLRIFDSKAEAEYWRDTLSQAHRDDQCEGQSP